MGKWRREGLQISDVTLGKVGIQNFWHFLTMGEGGYFCENFGLRHMWATSNRHRWETIILKSHDFKVKVFSLLPSRKTPEIGLV